MRFARPPRIAVSGMIEIPFPASTHLGFDHLRQRCHAGGVDGWLGIARDGVVRSADVPELFVKLGGYTDRRFCPLTNYRERIYGSLRVSCVTKRFDR